MSEFNNDSSMIATFVVSIYFLGFAFGPLVVAPMSEVFGRVYVYHIGNIAFTAFSIAAACSVNIGMLMAFRFLMGLVGCVPTTIGAGSIVDMISLEKRGRAISLWAVGPLLGPCVGPIAGGYLIEAAGWRWVYWLLAIMVCSLNLHYKFLGAYLQAGRNVQHLGIPGHARDLRASSARPQSSPFAHPERQPHAS